jgi:hypothetical protein
MIFLSLGIFIRLCLGEDKPQPPDFSFTISALWQELPVLRLNVLRNQYFQSQPGTLRGIIGGAVLFFSLSADRFGLHGINSFIMPQLISQWKGINVKRSRHLVLI